MEVTAPISFEQARHIAAAATGQTIALWGWENADVFVLSVVYPEGGVPKGEETPVVDRRTGKLRWEFSPRGEPVVAGLRPIGTAAD